MMRLSWDQRLDRFTKSARAKTNAVSM